MYSYATHVAEVEVDTETGAVRLIRVTAAHDVGKVLNPETLEGQIHGGVLQGVGMALCEKMQTDGGRIVTPDFATYIIPTAADVPEIDAVFVEHPYSRGPFGAKGIGETPAMPGAAAIANAVAHAIGVRFEELPITAESVKRVLAERKTGMKRLAVVAFMLVLSAAPAAAGSARRRSRRRPPCDRHDASRPPVPQRLRRRARFVQALGRGLALREAARHRGVRARGSRRNSRLWARSRAS